jgi:hypothetical protein|tara:strand:- start:16406 stop:16780 length:375 start_codon:yes stop_codon:yes gene_type:complete
MDIANILVSLNKRNNNDYQFVVYGNPTTEEEFKENVNFVSESYTWAEVQTEKPLAEFDYSMEELRKKRNNLLNQTDYIVIKAKETGGTIPSAWKTYRQELRDLTNGLTTVDEVNAVEFPERPST